MILDLLTKEELKLVRYQSLKSEEILFHEDDKCLSIGIVVSGEIKISCAIIGNVKISIMSKIKIVPIIIKIGIYLLLN